ncbi:unnamed protein product [Caenorhabditis angaria]|uniref:BHLH domain-containing protein n=1 Tax=Caenorhabditis angaria TaxID=860376 RepID=A0A9P1MXR1_9PELO|nr:unnamed protein product [Caenorhabditis angaria]
MKISPYFRFFRILFWTADFYIFSDSTKWRLQNSLQKGESAQKRQTRSIHEKQRRIEMNQVLTEMMELLMFDTKLQPKKPDKCWIIGKSVEFIRKNRIPEENSLKTPSGQFFFEDFLRFSGNFVIFELSEMLLVEKIEGDSKAIFGDRKMIGRDFRSFLDFDSGVNFETRKNVGRIWNSIIGKRFSAFWENNKLLCFAEPSKLAEERPILAAMLSTPSPTSEAFPKSTQNLDDTNTTITPSLHCDDSASSSSAFLSPQSSSSESKKKPRRGRKRLRSVNVIVETYSLDSVITPPKKGRSQNLESSASASTSTSLLNPTSQIPALISPTPPPLNPYDVLTPGYRDIWLRLQSERLLLEQRVLAKERELQNLMMSTYSTPP